MCSVPLALDAACESTASVRHSRNGTLAHQLQMATTKTHQTSCILQQATLAHLHMLLVCSGDHSIKLHSWPEGKPVKALQENGHTRTPWTVSNRTCADDRGTVLNAWLDNQLCSLP
jgi:hypothetical protein